MVKSYLRYVEAGRFGVISSPSSNALFDASSRLAVVGALEDVVVWNLRQGEITQRWRDSDNSSAVTVLVRCPTNDRYAVGYEDGSIRVWEMGGSLLVTLRGHRSAVSALCFDRTGTRLASGSKDTDLILWDLVGEVGLFR